MLTMKTYLQQPQPFHFEENVSNIASGHIGRQWFTWKETFQMYATACGLELKNQDVQVNTLLYIIGSQCRQIYVGFMQEFTTTDALLAKYDEYFIPKKNITLDRHNFLTRNQMDSESVEDYIFELNKLVTICEFNELQNDLVRDRLICGLRENALRRRLLKESELSLEKAIDICMTFEFIKREFQEELYVNTVAD